MHTVIRIGIITYTYRSTHKHRPYRASMSRNRTYCCFSWTSSL